MILSDAYTLLHRMVLVRPDSTTFANGVQPLIWFGMWSGTIVAIEPIKKDDVVVDFVLQIKLSFGTARVDRTMSIPFSSNRWKLRFPQK